MNMWNDGYIVDIEYNANYFNNLHPQLLNLNLTFAGYDVGDGHSVSASKDLSYLELGFGKGLSLAIFSCGNEGEFMGTDFNPSHALSAKKLIGEQGKRVQIFDDSFKELSLRLEKEGLEFDYIVLHGIWSWVSYENTQIILKIIQNHLKIGGVVYNSYNCYPGWDGKLSARRLLKLYEDHAQGTKEEKALSCMQFFQDFLDTKPNYAVNNPRVEDVLQMIKTQDQNYLIHEFFNSQESGACYFSEMAEWMQSVKCEFACGANIGWHFEGVSEEANTFFQKIGTNMILKEQLKDYCYNRQFRADIFIKGKARITQKQIFDRFLNTNFVMIDIPNETLQLSDKQRAIAEFFAEDNYRVKSAGEVKKAFDNMDTSELASHFAQLITLGIIFICKKEIDEPSKVRCEELNARILQRQKQGVGLKYLVSPLSGSGIFVDEISQLFILALKEGLECKKELLVNFVWQWLEDMDKKMSKEGKILESEKENKKELGEYFDKFKAKLPLYKVLCLC